MDALARKEQEKYRRTWAESPAYRARSPGEHVAAVAYQVCGMKPVQGIVDWGCGTGRALQVFAGFGMKIVGVDITREALDQNLVGKFPFIEACLWAMKPRRLGYWGFSSDVLEHIPPGCVDATLRFMARSAQVAFHQIAHFPDGERVDGTGPLHLTVEPPDFWRMALENHWRKVEDVTEAVQALLAAPMHPERTCWICKN